MDRKIENGGKKKKRIQVIIIAGLVILLFILIFKISATGGRLKVDGSRLRFSEVQNGIFEDVISIQGNVEPKKSFFLDAVEGGTVMEVFVETGTMVEEGQPLLRLSNTQLMLDFMNRETQIVEQINNLRNTRIQMELNERNIREQLLDIAYEKETMERKFQVDTSLYASRVIALQEFQDSRDRYRYLEKKQILLENSFQKDEKYRTIQLELIDQSIAMMERNLEAIRDNLENLTVKAPLAGQLTSFDAEIGESKVKGENLGRIDVLDEYVVRAQVDEHYLSRVKAEQTATFSIGENNYKLTAARIFPEVMNNQFTVEFNFMDSIPGKIRRGQTIAMRLSLSSSVEAVMVPRGAFYSSSGGKWVYVVSEEEKIARKREVKLGRQNPDFIEVVDGLAPGEKIISSSYDTFSDYEVIVIEE